jgi:hypothetical protein
MTDTNTTNTKPIACSQGCKMSFALKKSMQAHIRRGCPGVEEKVKVSLLCVECGATFTERKAKARHVAKCAPKGTKETPLLVADAIFSVNDGSTVELSSRQNQDNVSEQIERALQTGEEEFKEPTQRKSVRLPVAGGTKVCLGVNYLNPITAKRFALGVTKRAATVSLAVKNVKKLCFPEIAKAYCYSTPELHFVMIDEEDED